MSPSSPKLGTPESAFGKVTLPWMLMTGTKDIAVIGNADMNLVWKFSCIATRRKIRVGAFSCRTFGFHRTSFAG